MPVCGKCGKPIEFILMENGKKMPVDSQKVYVRKDPDGLVKAVEVIWQTGHAFNAYYTTKGAPGAIKAFQTHWPNCAEGITRTAKLSQAEWRKRQEGNRPARVTKSSQNHPHFAHEKKPEPKQEQIALF